MKRVFSLFLVLLLLLPVLVVPASASAIIQPYVESDDLYGLIFDIWETICFQLENFMSSVLEHWGLLQNWLKLISDNLINTVSKTLLEIYKTVNDIFDWIVNWVVKLLQDIHGHIETIDSNLTFFYQDFRVWVGSMWYTMVDSLYKLVDGFYKDAVDSWLNIEDYLFQLVHGSKIPADDFEDDANTITDDTNDALDGLDKLDKPDPGDINFDTGGFIGIPPQGVAMLVAPLTAILGSSAFLPMLLMVFTLAVLAYVLYGKV